MIVGELTGRQKFWSTVVIVILVAWCLAGIDRSGKAPKQTAKEPTVTLSGEQRIAGSHWWGCADRDYQGKLVGYLVDGDVAAFEAAWVRGKMAGTCATFTDGELVYVADTAIWSGLVKVRRQGELQEYWTNIEAIGK